MQHNSPTRLMYSTKVDISGDENGKIRMAGVNPSFSFAEGVCIEPES